MSTECAHLALMLDAPLMSFGHSSRFTRRATALHPTRSALLGMICAAAGAEKGSAEESDWLRRLGFPAVTMAVLHIPRQPSQGTRPLPIRRLEDFHTTGGGFDRRTHAHRIPRKAGGGPCDNATLSHRAYLMDARFGVILSGARATLDAVAAALRDPRWGIWFGRKACIPAAPILRGVAETADQAMALLGLSDGSLDAFAAVVDAGAFDEGTDTLLDVPVSFAARTFAPRRIDVRPPRRRPEA